MKYLLILFVIALALAPLSHFVPSKKQRKVARMREYAAVHGLFVEFRKLPGSGGTDGRQPGTPRGDIIYYGRRLPPPRGSARRGDNWLQDEQGWRSLGRRVPVPDALLDLPPAMLAASVDDSSCGVYWQEAGEQEDVEKIRQVLEAWSTQLCS